MGKFGMRRVTRKLETSDLERRGIIIYVAKTKAVTGQVVFAFVST